MVTCCVQTAPAVAARQGVLQRRATQQPCTSVHHAWLGHCSLHANQAGAGLLCREGRQAVYCCRGPVHGGLVRS